MALISCPECGKSVSDLAPTCPNCGAPIAKKPQAPPQVIYQQVPSPQQPKKSSSSCLSAGCLVAIIIAVIWGVGIMVSNSGSSSSSSGSGGSSNSSFNSTPTPAPSPDDSAARNVQLVNFEWHKGGFDNVMLANFTIRNNNDFPVKDITVTCTHSGPSGTEIDKNTRTIYDVIKPKKKRTFEDFNMGWIHTQAVRSRCEITSVKIVQ